MAAALSFGLVALVLSGWPHATSAVREEAGTDDAKSVEREVVEDAKSEINPTMRAAMNVVNKKKQQQQELQSQLNEANANRQREEEKEREILRQAAQTKNAEKKAKLEQHRKDNLQDCKFTEEWGEWGACSATCGGGIMTQQLKSRVITQKQDRFGYGKPCSPRECSDRDKSGCGERNFKPCATDFCEIDCSVVDLSNRLPGPGAAAGWTYQRASPQGQCVFQFWQVLAGDASTSPRLRLLGETSPQVDTASDATVLDTNSRRGEEPLILREGGGIDHKSVALGVRGCKLAAAKGSAIARVCLNAREGFREDNQVVDMNKMDGESRGTLRKYRADSRQALSVDELTDVAGRKEGLGQGDAKVTVPTALPPGPAAFELQVAMQKQAPEAPSFQPYKEEGDAIRLHVTVAGGGKLHLAVRKVFGKISSRNRGYCQFIPLPECGGGAAPGAACVDDGLLLRNLPFASNYEVKVWGENEAGKGKAKVATIPVRGQKGVELKKCQVHYWSCTAGDGEEYSEVFPEEGSPQCELEGPAIPACQMAEQKDLWGNPKCDGKKFWRTCQPHMWHGERSCVGGDAQAVCVHGGTAKSDKQGTSPTACNQPGCPSSLFTTANCCCKSSADNGEDSPNCACTKMSCAELGLVAAADGMRSCRH